MKDMHTFHAALNGCLLRKRQ